MSVTKEIYLVLGIKFGEDFTNAYFNSECFDDLEYSGNEDKLSFIFDGMNGLYTFFGIVTQLSNGEYEEETKELNLLFNFDKNQIVQEFKNLFPAYEVSEQDVKLYYLPHWT